MISVVTACVRGELLARNLSSQAPFATTVIVIDDSLNGSMLPVAKKAKALGLTVRYIGIEERESYSSLFSRALRPSLEWALSKNGNSLGASRNAALLDTRGARVFLSDDDVVCRCATTTLEKKVTGFSSRAAALRAVKFTSSSIYDICELALDSSPVAVFGYVGDSGARSPHFVEGTTQRTREVVRHPCPYSLMLGAAAIDNGSKLPPFYPHGRNSDGLWGVMLSKRAFPLPWLVEHDPAEDRGLSSRASSVADVLVKRVQQAQKLDHANFESLISNWEAIVQESVLLAEQGFRLSVSV